MVKLLIGRDGLGYPMATVETDPPTGLHAIEVWARAITAAGFAPAPGGAWRRKLRDGVVLVATVVPKGDGAGARVGVCSLYADDEMRELCAFFCDRPEDFASFVALPARKAKRP
jgi:hypothetical protein